MDVIKFIEGNKLVDESVADIVYDLYGKNDDRVLIIGGGKAAITVSDIILQNPNQKIVGILDDNPDFHNKNIFGFEILGSVSLIDKLWEEDYFDSVIISFSGNIYARKRIFEEIHSKGIPFTNAIDKSVQIHKNVKIGVGNVIFGNCRVGVCATIGDNNVISAYTSLEHHNHLGSHCTFGPGVICSGTVTIGDKVKFGTGIFIEPRLKIGDNSIISSGSIITLNIPSDSVVKKVVDIKIQ
jgi:sugar O-acyltransferase (sialic acid O-acetyltransferase NeuD family)